MDFKQDIIEIICSISESGLAPYDTNETCCLRRLTKMIEDDYLTGRAKYILFQITKQEDLLKAIKKLSQICNKNNRRCKICPVQKYCNYYIWKCRKKVRLNNTIVDLFCGAGGLSLGFTQEGFSVVLANDVEECCVETYAHNHPEIPRKRIVQGDIKEIVDDLEDLINDSVDVVIGGPPCQGFSMANRQRLIDDPRNQLYRSYVEVVKKISPKFFVMENVKGMIGVAPQVKEDFEKIGYAVSYQVLNAKDYGVPQNRERLIFIGNRIKVDNELVFEGIREQSKQYPSFVLGDALFGLRPLKAARVKNKYELSTKSSGGTIETCRINGTNQYLDLINRKRKSDLVFNHRARYNNERDIEIFRRLRPGDRSDDPKIADIMPYTRRNGIFKDKYYKLNSKALCKTITAHMKYDCNMYIHPSQARGLTPREAARVQSYPDDYFFKGAFTKTYMQIGNSVPPLLGRSIATVLKRYL